MVNETELRSEFEGQPNWAGSKGQRQGRGQGQGMGMMDGSHYGNGGASRGQNSGGSFVDADGDGECDHLN